MANGFAHKIERLNAFVACTCHAEGAHAPMFMICRTCRRVAETAAAEATEALSGVAATAGFRVTPAAAGPERPSVRAGSIDAPRLLGQPRGAALSLRGRPSLPASRLGPKSPPMHRVMSYRPEPEVSDEEVRARLASPRDRRRAYRELLFRDHHLLRLIFQNAHEIGGGMWRSNQPGPGQLERWAERGIKTVINLRGVSPAGFHIVKVNDHRENRQIMADEYRANHLLIETNELVDEQEAMQIARDLRQLERRALDRLQRAIEVRLDEANEAIAGLRVGRLLFGLFGLFGELEVGPVDGVAVLVDQFD